MLDALNPLSQATAGKRRRDWPAKVPGPRHERSAWRLRGILCAKRVVLRVPHHCWAEIKVWDVDERKRVMVLQGHEATVCSVVADECKIVSGAADKVR